MCYIVRMNIPLTHAAEGLERRAFTVKDVLRMVEMGVLGRDERFELIGGEIVPMSPKGIRHEIIKQWVNQTLVKQLSDDFDIIPETTFYLSDDTFIEPDFVIYPAGQLAELSPQTCKLAIEIGDSSLSYDLGRKARLYAEFGIQELWVIDANSHETTVHRDPKDGSYGTITQVAKDADLSPRLVPDLTLRLSDMG